MLKLILSACLLASVCNAPRLISRHETEINNCIETADCDTDTNCEVVEQACEEAWQYVG